MYCKHCGKEIADDSKFCNHCGKEQDNQELVKGQTANKAKDKTPLLGRVKYYIPLLWQ